MTRPVREWVEHRTGLETLLKNFLYEEIPASSGWHQVFGSVALFLFLLQGFTGVLLAFNYAPTPGEAHNSLQFIVTEVTGGRMIRGLHHWGASTMIVVVVLHMIQVFWYGAYHRPREATWMVGVVLLLVVLGFGLTGYLLPWDNRAYWGTVVTTQIMSQAPLIGPYLSRLLGGDSGIGVVTFARFYSLHVLLLPLATIGLTVLHIYLVRKHGVAPVVGDEAPKKRFFPAQVLKDTVAIFAVFVALFLMAVFLKVPLGRLADPTDTSYIPRPDWYFLFLFQMLKFFSGKLEVLGAVILPGLAVLTLFLVPFLDRGKLRRVRSRTGAMVALVLAVIFWTTLTVAAIRTTPHTPDMLADDITSPQDWQQLTPDELAGVGYYRREGCATCHTTGEGGAKVGPDLAAKAVQRSASWMIEHFQRPAQMVPGTSMPAITLSRRELNGLASFLLKMNRRNAAALQSAPTFAVEGAMVYQKHQCGACHRINGSGQKLGPALNGLAGRRSREWVERHFAEPQALSPGTTMPPYPFAPKELEQITRYLFSMPEN